MVRRTARRLPQACESTTMTTTESGVLPVSAAGAASVRHRHWRPSAWLWVLLFFFVITTLFLLPWISQRDAWTGGHGDEVLETWYLGWVPWAIAHGQNPLITHLLDYPDGVNVMWNTSVPLLGLLGAPINWLLGPRVEYHVWLTAGIGLSGFFAYLFMSRRARLVPAVLCGVIYAFSPFMAFQALGHLHEAFAATPPLLLILFDDLLVRRVRSAPRTGVYLGLVIAAQLLIGEEVLATELLMAPLVLAILAVLYRRNVASQLSTRLRTLCGALAVAVPVAGLISAAPLYVQFFGPQRLTGAVQMRDYYVTDLLNVIVPTTEWLTPRRAAQIATHFTAESTAYVSVPGLLLAGGTMSALRRSRLAWWAALSMALAFVLSLGPHLHIDGLNTGIPLPGAPIDGVPVLQSIIPARFSEYIFLFMGVLVALGLDAAWAVVGRRRWPLCLAAVMTTLTLTALSPPLPEPVFAHPIPGFFTGSALARIPEGSIVLVAPWQHGFFSPIAGTDATPMLWQQITNYRYGMPSGYALVPPPASTKVPVAPDGGIVAEELLEVWSSGHGMDPADVTVRARTLQKLRSWRLAAIIVGPMQNRPIAVQFFTSILGRAPEEVGGVDLWMGPFG
jgi:hypothetical protein